MKTKGNPIVYFLQCGLFIKIGTTTDRLATARLSTIRGSNPDPVAPLGYIDGGKDLETQLHKRFKPFRYRGEWFINAPELLRYVRANSKPWEFKWTRIDH